MFTRFALPLLTVIVMGLAACGGGAPAASAPASSAAAKPASVAAPASTAASASAKPATSAPTSAAASASAKPSASGALAATAEVKDATGKTIGTATLSPTTDGVIVSGTFQGLNAGPHGWHIHAVGKCEGPAFTTAGGHFNPTGKQHGVHNPDGFHAGDLGNIVFPASGTVTIRSIARGASMASGQNSLFGPDGTSLVIHAGLDDDESDPAGNSGDRVACGVITAGTGGAAASAKPAASTAGSAAASAAASAKPAGSAAASGSTGSSTVASAKPSA